MRKEIEYIMRVDAQNQQFYVAIDDSDMIENIIIAIAMVWGSESKLAILQEDMRTYEITNIFYRFGYLENMS